MQLMKMKALLILTALTVLPQGFAFAQGDKATASKPVPGVFTSSRGFSISYPKGWAVASKEQSAEVAKEMKPFLEKMGRNVDLDRIAAMIFDTNSKQFVTSLNVVVSPGVIPINDESREKIEAIAQQTGQAFGSAPTELKTAIEPFAGRQAITSRYNIKISGVNVSQMQVAIPGRNQSYIVTCSCAKADAERYQPVFKAMLESMKVDQGVAGYPDVGKNILVYSVIGAFAGGVASLFLKRQRKPRE